MNVWRALTRFNLVTMVPLAAGATIGAWGFVVLLSKRDPELRDQDNHEQSMADEYIDFRVPQINDAKAITATAGDRLMYYRLLNETLPRPVESLRNVMQRAHTTGAIAKYRQRRVENSWELARFTQFPVKVGDLRPQFWEQGVPETGEHHARMTGLTSQWQRSLEADKIRKPSAGLAELHRMKRVSDDQA
eukprot:TRINITY_DN16326_c0_g1_i1.p2 TRINITY_DN16326_c0_g1~~TRINITY_DN16326_c0_g1_i1.p2  ORF type:complete len:190 (-),score=53.20 TRINITY_DN16326_c0_g1_i1:27-596(-)